MQFALVAHDYADDDALNKHIACQEVHFKGLRVLAKKGIFVSGGVVLDATGKIVGSNAHC